MDLESGRRKGVEHEARWVNLLGFALRPGYGLAVDDWRVAETWRTVQGKLVHASPAVRSEAIILWRRIAGGLSRGQQQALADPLLSSIRSLHHRYTAGTHARRRCAAATERTGGDLATAGLAGIARRGAQDRTGRHPRGAAAQTQTGESAGPDDLGAGPAGAARAGVRAAQHGRAAATRSSGGWTNCCRTPRRTPRPGALAIMQIARRTDDRYRDIADKCRRRVVAWLDDQQAPPHLTNSCATAANWTWKNSARSSANRCRRDCAWNSHASDSWSI